MSLEKSLELTERFAAKIWRKYAKEDPIAQLSFNEYDYLKVVQTAREPIRLTDLAAELEVTKPSATNMVKRLERKGLVARVPCLTDARSKRVVLTALALESLSNEAQVYSVWAKRVSERLNHAEARQLEQLLMKAMR
ncbi:MULTISPECIES: MarR family winged helix-turn-helix transcriptional regulator [unclassified Vibrio]|uniref:MarR family winged helix-turn-helix transcriptional regulator n=1 Tax=unclassified Vibrio TaxID=2614977 RepID=UPI001360C035|nr:MULTISPECIES: MarR family transcriptional regulator [unclassified Vibrio]NAW58093.1 MarR family transcriptional regulator [Vibrio sp. V36_P2S2PM302]NAX25232.1 MarR family transcriptional regulator [Vibrio sp. V38_P2S17PM301]NAX28789.1 MarR family transcriptional regulator [Vibrio sp. V37_P2S8PM304]